MVATAKTGAMQRNYVQLDNQFKYGRGNTLKAIGFYSYLNYQTPGGLTLAQQVADPSSARLASPTVASAIDLDAHITNKMLYGGLVNDARISDNLRNVVTVYGTQVEFLNPSFTTYEERNEGTIGFSHLF